jgi:hypothetical protein
MRRQQRSLLCSMCSSDHSTKHHHPLQMKRGPGLALPGSSYPPWRSECSKGRCLRCVWEQKRMLCMECLRCSDDLMPCRSRLRKGAYTFGADW